MDNKKLVEDKARGFALLEDVVFKFDRDWEEHIPRTWSTEEAVRIRYGRSFSSSITRVFNEDSTEVGVVLAWEELCGAPDLGYFTEPLETFEIAFFTLSLELVGEEKLKSYLAD